MTNWEALSTVKPRFIDDKQLNKEHPGIKYTEAKWQPLWMKLAKRAK